MLKYLVILLIMIMLTSCFKEDIPVMPHEGNELSITESIYTHRSYFELASGSVVAVNPVEAWDLGFESSKTGWHIIVNSGRYMGIWSSHSTGFEGITSVPSTAVWKFDKSDGNKDSTAVGNWLSPETGIPSGEVYVLGINNGVKYVPYRKIVFLSVSPGTYSFRYSEMNGSGENTYEITKDTTRNFVYFSFSDGAGSVIIEPEKTGWDVVFTQYATTLYTDDGIPTPYFVRGGLSNPCGVEVALDTLTAYEEISSADIQRFPFSPNEDAIGYDWKTVQINDVSATYSIRQNFTYIIKSVTGDYYKLRFTGFYDDSGAPGYPRFETERIEK